MEGKIVKGIAGFYYVLTKGDVLYECKAKGSFRNKKIKPLVGDNVEIDVVDKDKLKGNISNILDRKNELIRPNCANIDMALVVFALKDPDPSLILLDRFLVMMESQNIKSVICFNKSDIADEEKTQTLKEIYQKAGYDVFVTSIAKKEGISDIRDMLKGKTTVFAGPSGVGKSSMLNELFGDYQMETGEVSKKIGRGKNTTRHTEIFEFEPGSFALDTPGFSSIYAADIKKEQLQEQFPEFRGHKDECRFATCAHINEPDCKIKELVDSGDISKERYDSYVSIYEELKENERRYV